MITMFFPIMVNGYELSFIQVMSVYKRLKLEREQIYKIPDSRLGKNVFGFSRLINIINVLLGDR